jgi:energy-coupling factor transporter ATP-binding protein EcfA2
VRVPAIALIRLGGEQQRVAVCAASGPPAGLLLADEPAGELDAANAEVVYRLLGELVRDANATALIVSHDAAAASIADRLVYIRDGRIVEEARPGFRRALVISRKGWARLPHELAPLAPRFADASIEGGRIVITRSASWRRRWRRDRAGSARRPDGRGDDVERWGDRRLRRVSRLPRRGLAGLVGGRAGR